MQDELLRRIQSLSLKINTFKGVAEKDDAKIAALYAAACIQNLLRMLEAGEPIFGIEPWHKIQDSVPLAAPGEMLLRLRDEKGGNLQPYPAIMAFYNNGMTAELDTVLVLCALQQFLDSDMEQVSINVSGRSLRDADFIKTILPRIEAMALPKPRKIIFEIHESAADQVMSQKVLELCRKLGIAFAMDDVGLSLNDIFRLSEFEQIADFVKLDRATVRTHQDKPKALDHVLKLVNATLPFATIVAEGVQSAEHAATLLKHHRNIQYVQGLYLPDRETFATQFAEIKARSVA